MDEEDPINSEFYIPINKKSKVNANIWNHESDEVQVYCNSKGQKISNIDDEENVILDDKANSKSQDLKNTKFQYNLDGKPQEEFQGNDIDVENIVNINIEGQDNIKVSEKVEEDTQFQVNDKIGKQKTSGMADEDEESSKVGHQENDDVESKIDTRIDDEVNSLAEKEQCTDDATDLAVQDDCNEEHQSTMEIIQQNSYNENVDVFNIREDVYIPTKRMSELSRESCNEDDFEDKTELNSQKENSNSEKQILDKSCKQEEDNKNTEMSNHQENNDDEEQDDDNYNENTKKNKGEQNPRSVIKVFENNFKEFDENIEIDDEIEDSDDDSSDDDENNSGKYFTIKTRIDISEDIPLGDDNDEINEVDNIKISNSTSKLFKERCQKDDNDENINVDNGDENNEGKNSKSTTKVFQDRSKKDDKGNAKIAGHLQYMDYFDDALSHVHKVPKSDLNLIVCGKCHDVFYFFEEFYEHKGDNNDCDKALQINTSVKEAELYMWAFLMWKNSLGKHSEEEGESNMWKLYKQWLNMPFETRDNWVISAEDLKLLKRLGEIAEAAIKNGPYARYFREPENEWEDKKSEDDTQLKDPRGDFDVVPKCGAVKKQRKWKFKPKRVKNPEEYSNLRIRGLSIDSRGHCEYITTYKFNGDEEYVVERILSKRFNVQSKSTEYLIKWHGRSNEENTWESGDSTKDFASLVKAYERKSFHYPYDGNNKKKKKNKPSPASSISLSDISFPTVKSPLTCKPCPKPKSARKKIHAQRMEPIRLLSPQRLTEEEIKRFKEGAIAARNYERRFPNIHNGRNESIKLANVKNANAPYLKGTVGPKQVLSSTTDDITDNDFEALNHLDDSNETMDVEINVVSDVNDNDEVNENDVNENIIIHETDEVKGVEVDNTEEESLSDVDIDNISLGISDHSSDPDYKYSEEESDTSSLSAKYNRNNAAKSKNTMSSKLERTHSETQSLEKSKKIIGESIISPNRFNDYSLKNTERDEGKECATQQEPSFKISRPISLENILQEVCESMRENEVTSQNSNGQGNCNTEGHTYGRRLTFGGIFKKPPRVEENGPNSLLKLRDKNYKTVVKLNANQIPMPKAGIYKKNVTERSTNVFENWLRTHANDLSIDIVGNRPSIIHIVGSRKKRSSTRNNNHLSCNKTCEARSLPSPNVMFPHKRRSPSPIRFLSKKGKFVTCPRASMIRFSNKENPPIIKMLELPKVQQSPKIPIPPKESVPQNRKRTNPNKLTRDTKSQRINELKASRPSKHVPITYPLHVPLTFTTPSPIRYVSTACNLPDVKNNMIKGINKANVKNNKVEKTRKPDVKDTKVEETKEPDVKKNKVEETKEPDVKKNKVEETEKPSVKDNKVEEMEKPEVFPEILNLGPVSPQRPFMINPITGEVNKELMKEEGETIPSVGEQIPFIDLASPPVNPSHSSASSELGKNIENNNIVHINQDDSDGSVNAVSNIKILPQVTIENITASKGKVTTVELPHSKDFDVTIVPKDANLTVENNLNNNNGNSKTNVNMKAKKSKDVTNTNFTVKKPENTMTSSSKQFERSNSLLVTINTESNMSSDGSSETLSAFLNSVIGSKPQIAITRKINPSPPALTQFRKPELTIIEGNDVGKSNAPLSPNKFKQRLQLLTKNATDRMVPIAPKPASPRCIIPITTSSNNKFPSPITQFSAMKFSPIRHDVPVIRTLSQPGPPLSGFSTRGAGVGAGAGRGTTKSRALSTRGMARGAPRARPYSRNSSSVASSRAAAALIRSPSVGPSPIPIAPMPANLLPFRTAVSLAKQLPPAISLTPVTLPISSRSSFVANTTPVSQPARKSRAQPNPRLKAALNQSISSPVVNKTLTPSLSPASNKTFMSSPAVTRTLTSSPVVTKTLISPAVSMPLLSSAVSMPLLSPSLSIINVKETPKLKKSNKTKAKKEKKIENKEKVEKTEKKETEVSNVELKENQDTSNSESTITITGEDGQLFEVPNAKLEGNTIFVQTEQGEQQCLFVTEDGQTMTPTIKEDGSTILTLDDSTVLNESVKEEPIEISSSDIVQLSEEGLLEGTEGIEIEVEEGVSNDIDNEKEVVAQLVEASDPSPDGGPRKVVLLLPDGNLLVTEVDEEQFALLGWDASQQQQQQQL